MKDGEFRIRLITAKEHGSTYQTYQLVGYLNGQRIRKRFKTREEALGEQNRQEVAAANRSGSIRAVNTRLTSEQVGQAEVAFARLGDRSLVEAVDWYLANYRPPVIDVLIETATAAFTTDRKGHISTAAEKDYRMIVGMLTKTFPKRPVASITTEELEALIRTRGKTKKSFNNVRVYVNAIFEFCADSRRRWISINPVRAIRKYEIARGTPEVISAAAVAKFFAFLESYSGPAKCRHRPGYLIPYFALATFAGIRPSVKNGELFKLHHLVDKSRAIDEAMGVIRLEPGLTKTNNLRSVTIQPNLAAWLKRYPVKEWPLMVPNMEDHVSRVRKLFKLPNDVLRHTFVSMHVAKFRSLGDTALQAGNSEAIIRKHYFNLVSGVEAEEFWAIVPTSSS